MVYLGNVDWKVQSWVILQRISAILAAWRVLIDLVLEILISSIFLRIILRMFNLLFFSRSLFRFTVFFVVLNVWNRWIFLFVRWLYHNSLDCMEYLIGYVLTKLSMLVVLSLGNRWLIAMLSWKIGLFGFNRILSDYSSSIRRIRFWVCNSILFIQ